ncbi:MAG: AbrB family transcriptional regulator [Desulfuromonadales bacterium C00003093]|nr:MAG: AbrB family transcriptional regulator [Desulfuromonadales bacterium C00003093]
MTTLVRIGNSQGVRIPKAIIEQAQLTNKELILKIVDEGLLITPVTKARDGWKEKFDQVLQCKNAENVDQEWLDAPLADDEEWEW